VVVLVIAHFGRRGRRDTHAWGVPLALSAGFTVAFIGISGKLNFPPRQGQEWLVLACVAALMISIMASWSDRTRWPVAGLSFALLLAIAWFFSANRRQHLPSRQAWMTLAFIAGGLVLWWSAMEPLSRRWRGGTLPFLLSGVAGAAALVIIDGGSQRLGVIEGGVAVLLLVVAAMALWLCEMSLSRGGVLTIAIVVYGLLACGYLYADVTWPQAALLAAAPLMAWVGALPIVRTRRPWIRFGIALALVLAVTAIAAVPAANGLRKTMKEQTESYME
jgi:hypothetical protein